MKRAILISILFILIFSGVSHAQVSVTELIKIGEGRYWSPPPLTRNLPVYVRTAGSVVGRNWWKVGLSWGSVALIAGSLAYDVYKDHYGEPSIADLLNKIGVRYIGDQGQAKNGTARVFKEGSGSAIGWANWVAAKTGQPYGPYTVTLISMHDTYSAMANARVAWANNHYPEYGGGTIENAAGLGSVGYVYNSSTKDYAAFVYVANYATDTELIDQWINKTNSEVTTIINNYWNTPAPAEAEEKAAWERLEQLIKDALDTNPGSSILISVNPSNNKTTKENFEDEIEDDIRGETDPDAEGEGFSEQILEAIQALPQAIITAMTSLFGLSEPPPTYTNDGDENDTVIGQEGINTQKTTEQDETESILDGLWSSVGGLRNTINAKIEALLGAGGACSPWTETVYGSEFKLDLCVIDWSPWRAAIIALGCIFACFILIGL